MSTTAYIWLRRPPRKITHQRGKLSIYFHPPARPPAPRTRAPATASATMSASASSSRRRNYLLHPHRTDGLIGFIKEMLHHSFVLDIMASSTDATWRHIEELVEEHRGIVAALDAGKQTRASRLSESVPTVSRFFTPLPLREVCAPPHLPRESLLCLQRLHWSAPPYPHPSMRADGTCCTAGLDHVRRQVQGELAPLRAAVVQRGSSRAQPGAGARDA